MSYERSRFHDGDEGADVVHDMDQRILITLKHGDMYTYAGEHTGIG